jgi:uncharacterized protein
VIEQVELQVPIRLLCREECRGLCPQCGADWNTEQCSCPPPIDPRWESLTGLRATDSPETDLPEGGRNRKGKRQA